MRHRNYLLAVLLVASVFNGIDGVALGLVLQDIKIDLSLSDTQLGLLTGIAFALLYSLVGLAIARWADRGDRVAIISLAMIVRSVLGAACGMATSFLQLFLLRVGVGIGEAGCFPASQSLIADYFDRAERPRATAFFLIAAGLTYMVGYGVAGWLNELYGWRVMFMMLGLPGVAVAVLAWLTLREPRFERWRLGEAGGQFGFISRALFKATARASEAPKLTEVAVTLWSNRTLRHLLLFWSVGNFVSTGLSQWQPAFFMRNHGMATGALGAWFAVAFGLGGIVGPLLGGAWASHYAVKNESRQLRVAAVVWCGTMFLSAFIYLVPNVYLAFVLLGLYMVATTAFCGPFWAMVQTLLPEGMRAAVIAVFMLLGSLVGSGFGPLATGALSDLLRVWVGGESLRYALLALCPVFLWAAWHLWQASSAVMHDLAAAQVGPNDRCDDDHVVGASSTVSPL